MPPGTKQTLKDLHAVIMAGGKGTRFWPLSRESFPKQFLKLLGDRTLIQDTIHRLKGWVPARNIHIVTTRNQTDIVDWQARQVLKSVSSIIEPEGRNTAPAIALVAFKLYKKNKDSLLLVLPSDHFVENSVAFASTITKAVPHAKKGRIITFGIKPTKPETGYGYIKAGGKIPGEAFSVQRFVEKPSLKKAREYLSDGSYYWNSGMFMFRAADIIEELKTYMPGIYGAFSEVYKHLNTKNEQKALTAIYGGLENESIDYGIMEKSKRVTMVGAGFGWSDIGNWGALDEVMEHDARGNVVLGNVTELKCSDSIFYTGDKLIAAIGLKGMVVVDTQDATLIAPKKKVQEVKELVGLLKRQGKEEYFIPGLEERPWGYFSVLEQGKNYKIKRIYIKPGAKLSLQMHDHRSEHWIVVSGTATVQNGENVFKVPMNESTFIPAKVKHRLQNKGKSALMIIEIQCGEYLGEDDIIRFDDVYGRNTK